MKKVMVLAAAAALGTSPAYAQEKGPIPEFTVSGGVTVASQYRFRGISLSDENVAVQGTINLNHRSGLYAGLWGGNIDGWGELGGSNLELDLYGGWKGEVAKNLTLDAGLLYFAYPGSKGGDFQFFEPYAKVITTLGPVGVTVGATYAWRQDALGGRSNFYLFNDNSLPITDTPITLTGHIGHSSGGSALAAGDDYFDWSLGASVPLKNLTLGVAYVDTNINDEQASSVGATPDIVDRAIIVSLGVSF